MIGRILAGRARPWFIAGAVAVGVAGWAAGAVQTVRYHAAVADLRAAETQVVIDANQSQQAVIDELKAMHAQDLRELESRIEVEREAVSSARAVTSLLEARVETLQHDLEELHDDPDLHEFLSQPVLDAARERVRAAQARHKDGNR